MPQHEFSEEAGSPAFLEGTLDDREENSGKISKGKKDNDNSEICERFYVGPLLALMLWQHIRLIDRFRNPIQPIPRFMNTGPSASINYVLSVIG